MKIVTWNCNGALRKKLSELEALDADLLIIQECEDPAASTPAYRDWAGNYLWKGLSKNKGIGIFPRKNHRVAEAGWNGSYQISSLGTKSAAASWRSDELELFLPFTLNDEYSILGVWTKGNDEKVFGYIGQFWKYVQIHKTKLASPKTLVLGDFNSNAIWDQPDRWWNHSDVVAELEEIGIHSVYHSSRSERQGSEKSPTLFLQRNTKKPYHVDYAFASSDLLHHCQMDVGGLDTWLHISDHMPLIVEFNP
jgi:exodeoxyribonuclease-3